LGTVLINSNVCAQWKNRRSCLCQSGEEDDGSYYFSVTCAESEPITKIDVNSETLDAEGLNNFYVYGFSRGHSAAAELMYITKLHQIECFGPRETN